MRYKPNPKRAPYSMSGLRPEYWASVIAAGGVDIRRGDNLPTPTADAAKAYQRWLAVMATISDDRVE